MYATSAGAPKTRRRCLARLAAFVARAEASAIAGCTAIWALEHSLS